MCQTCNREAAVCRCSTKLMLKVSQNSQENNCVWASYLIKLQVFDVQTYLKRASSTGVFLWNLRKLYIEHLLRTASGNTSNHFRVLQRTAVLKTFSKVAGSHPQSATALKGIPPQLVLWAFFWIFRIVSQTLGGDCNVAAVLFC